MIFSSAEHAKACIANARRALAAKDVTYPNGRSSHEAHGEILEQAEDYLMDLEMEVSP